MESFTETPWYVIPIFWIPIVSIAISLEVINERYMVNQIIVLFFLFENIAGLILSKYFRI